MNLVELGSVISEFFEGGVGPSHSELDAAFQRTGCLDLDPARSGRTADGSPLGKSKRIRQALGMATGEYTENGLRFAIDVISLLRAHGRLASSKTHEGFDDDLTDRLRSALRHLGYSLHSDGTVSQLVVDNLEGTALTEALRAHVRRLNANPDDAGLQVGVGKDLDETAARHVLKEKYGSYPIGGRSGSFPVTLAGAFSALGLSIPSDVKLNDDPHRGVQEALFLLGLQVNRLRNEVGTGHGRPDASARTAPLSSSEARLIARATSLLAGALLDSLN